MHIEKISEEICILRKEKKLTQKELAEIIHVSTSAVSKWETGVAMPDIYMLKRLANVFEISLSELLEGKKEIFQECDIIIQTDKENRK